MWATFSESCICLCENTQATILSPKLQLSEKIAHIFFQIQDLIFLEFGDVLQAVML